VHLYTAGTGNGPANKTPNSLREKYSERVKAPWEDGKIDQIDR